jgi:hypothetical protein
MFLKLGIISKNNFESNSQQNTTAGIIPKLNHKQNKAIQPYSAHIAPTVGNHK